MECSGKTSCSIVVGDEKIFGASPCMQLISYLEIEYYCQDVVESGSYQCQSCDGIPVKSPSGFFSSEITSETKCGSSICPWFLEAEKGQTIQLTIHDFSNKSTTQASRQCNAYALIEDLSQKKPERICRHPGEKTKDYESNGNSIKIQVLFEIASPFVIEYKYVGCKDIINLNMIIERQKNEAKIQCVNTKRKYNMKCVDKEWVGYKQLLCSDDKEENDSSEISKDLWAVLISSIIFMLGSCVTILGLWYFCRDKSLRDNDLLNNMLCDEPIQPIHSQYLQQLLRERIENYATDSRDYTLKKIDNYQFMTIEPG